MNTIRTAVRLADSIRHKLQAQQMNFSTDLKEGQLVERLVALFLRDRKYRLLDSFNNDNRYDLHMTNDIHNIKVEVKADRHTYEKADDFLIEFMSNRKPSGIRTTEADVYAYYYVVEMELYLISVKKLRAFIDEYRPSHCPGGDQNTSEMYTINRELYKDQIDYKKLNLNDLI